MYKLRVSRGKTINKGNYESARYDVSIEEEFEDIINRSAAYQVVSNAVKDMAKVEEENA